MNGAGINSGPGNPEEEKQRAFNHSVDALRAGESTFDDAIERVIAINAEPITVPARSAGFLRVFFQSFTGRKTKPAATYVAPLPQGRPRPSVRTLRRPEKRRLVKAMRAGALVAGAALVLPATYVAALVSSNWSEIETRVSDAKLGWECGETLLYTGSDGSSFYATPVKDEADCVGSDGKTRQVILWAPFETEAELFSHADKIGNVEGRWRIAETLMGFDAIGASGAIWRRVSDDGGGFSAPILSAFEAQQGERSFSSINRKLVSIAASIVFTQRYLQTDFERAQFVAAGNSFVLDGHEFAGALGQYRLYGGSGADIGLFEQCASVAGIKRQLRPGAKSSVHRAIKALETHVGGRFAACVSEASTSQIEKDGAMAKAQSICGGTDICLNPETKPALGSTMVDQVLKTALTDLRADWAEAGTPVEGAASILDDTFKLANLPAEAAIIPVTINGVVQQAVRAEMVSVRDMIEARTGVKPLVDVVIVDVSTETAQLLGAATNMPSGGVYATPVWDDNLGAYIEGPVLDVSMGSINKMPTAAVAYSQGETALCDHLACKSIRARVGESNNEAFENYIAENEADVRRLRSAIGYRAPSLEGQNAYGAPKDFNNGVVERIPVSQIIGFFGALRNGSFAGLEVIEGELIGAPFDLSDLGITGSARFRTIDAGKAAFESGGTLEGDKAKVSSPVCQASAKTGTSNAADDLFEKASIILHECDDGRAFVTFALIKAPPGNAFQIKTVTSDDLHTLHRKPLLAALAADT